VTDFQKEISVSNTSKPKTPSLTDQYLIEAGVDNYLLEDGSGA